jgi:ribonuclease HI
MHITDFDGDYYVIDIHQNQLSTIIKYSPKSKDIIFIENTLLTHILKTNLYQLKKILRNKRLDTFFPGFKLQFILRNNNDVIKLNDLSNLVIYNTENDFSQISVKPYYDCDFLQLFTDGAYSEKKGISAYVVLSKSEKGMYDLLHGLKPVKNSSLIELIAVIEGLKKFEKFDKLRIISDSRYVIKGITEWIQNWKLNDWHTAQGEKVKHIEYWKEYELLAKGKHLEFQWVKSHSSHFENTVCDSYATELLKRS